MIDGLLFPSFIKYFDKLRIHYFCSTNYPEGWDLTSYAIKLFINKMYTNFQIAS